MAVVKDGIAPYAPTAAVMGVINGYRTKHPKTPFTVENIQLLDVTASLAPRTLQALELLDLIDKDGEPTQAMIGLREASSDEFPARLAEVITGAYAELFAYRNPATDSPAALQDVFRFYRPPSMQDRMLRLFYGLCEAAGLVEQAPTIENKTAANGSSQRAPSTRRQRQKNEKTAPVTGPQTHKPPPSLHGRIGQGERIAQGELPDLVAAVVAKLPPKGATWTTDEFEWWIELLRLAAPHEYGFDPKPRETR